MTLTVVHADELVEKSIGNTDFTQEAAFEVGLFSAAPNADGTGGTELTGFGYSRQAVTTAQLTAASNGAKSNNVVITFSASGGNWASATHAVFFGTTTANKRLHFGPLQNAVQLDDGESASFAIGALSIDFAPGA